MEICVGTVDALLPSSDFSAQSTPNPVFTETPSYRHDGSVDSHRKLYRKRAV